MPHSTRPPEPAWTPEQQLRHLLTLLRAVTLQCATLTTLPNRDLRRQVKLLDDYVLNAQRSLARGGMKQVTAEKLTNAEDYFDNESALMWEVCNEVRKQPDPRAALLVLYSLTAGEVVEAGSGQDVRQMQFDDPAVSAGEVADHLEDERHALPPA